MFKSEAKNDEEYEAMEDDKDETPDVDVELDILS